MIDCFVFIVPNFFVFIFFLEIKFSYALAQWTFCWDDAPRGLVCRKSNGLIFCIKHIDVSWGLRSILLCLLSAIWDIPNLYSAIFHAILIYSGAETANSNQLAFYNCGTDVSFAWMFFLTVLKNRQLETRCTNVNIGTIMLMLFVANDFICQPQMIDEVTCVITACLLSARQIRCRWVRRKPWRPSGPTCRSNMKTGNPGWVFVNLLPRPGAVHTHHTNTHQWSETKDLTLFPSHYILAVSKTHR